MLRFTQLQNLGLQKGRITFNIYLCNISFLHAGDNIENKEKSESEKEKEKLDWDSDIGEGGASGEIIPGQSVVFATLEVWMSLV